MEKHRCTWVPKENKLYEEYHDKEWGVPVFDDNKIFEFLLLESAQAGLSWITVLKKRENYKKVFANFDPAKVAQFTEQDVERLLQDEGIIRNNAKINAAINNAKMFLQVQKEFGTFSKYIWGFVNNKPIINNWTNDTQIPAVTDKAIQISTDLKKRGFKFLGPTIIYAHMQATGMVNDHLTTCFRYRQILQNY